MIDLSKRCSKWGINLKSLNIKKSFIKKLFLSLALLYFIVFILIFLFQSTVFERFYQNRTIKTTISEIDDTFPLSSDEEINQTVLELSQSTQTTAILVPTNSLSDQFNLLQLQLIEVIYNDESYEIYVPNLEDVYVTGATVNTTLLYHSPTDRYIPLELTIDNKRIIHSRMGRINPLYRDYYPNLDLDNAIELSGELVNSTKLRDTNQTSINPIVSNEILNILSQNYDNLSQFSESGYYYFSTADTIEEQNIVYFLNTEIDGVPYTYISVFPMSHITDVVSAVRTINIYTFILIFVVLSIAALLYSNAFSKPLLTINNATKKLSQLDFSGDRIHIETDDEFNELAKNINTLSANLQTTLSQLSEQNKQLSKSLDVENENEQKRKDFIRGMSHELKTPLSVIQASSEALEKGIFTSEEDKDKQLNVIQKEVMKTNKMIKDMMLVYRLDTPQYKEKYQDVEIKTLIEDVMSRLSLLAKNNHVTMTLLSDDITLFSDSDKLEIVLTNLISNAIKYTPRNEEIKIEAKQIDKFLDITITNYGITIKDDDLPHLFEPFYRVNKEHERANESTGLGLYIVNQTLKQFDSECHVKNIDNGVAFTFQLKMNQ